jgi:hypothetical protein
MRTDRGYSRWWWWRWVSENIHTVKQTEEGRRSYSSLAGAGAAVESAGASELLPSVSNTSLARQSICKSLF